MTTVSDKDLERRIAQYDREVLDLRGQIKLLEEELSLTRRRLDAAPRQIASLEKRLAETTAELRKARDTNDRLADTLGWELPEDRFYAKSGEFLLKKGYSV